jgi:hypothetical protein
VSDAIAPTSDDIDVAESATASSVPPIDTTAAARRIKVRLAAMKARNFEDCVAIGTDALAVSRHLGRGRNGTFGQWCADNFGPAGRRTVFYCVQVARALENKPCNVALGALDVGALFDVTAQSVPVEVVNEVIARIEGGDIPDRRQIKALILDAREKTTPGSLRANREDAIVALLIELFDDRVHELVDLLVKSRWRDLGELLDASAPPRPAPPPPEMHDANGRQITVGSKVRHRHRKELPVMTVSELRNSKTIITDAITNAAYSWDTRAFGSDSVEVIGDEEGDQPPEQMEVAKMVDTDRTEGDRDG